MRICRIRKAAESPMQLKEKADEKWSARVRGNLDSNRKNRAPVVLKPTLQQPMAQHFGLEKDGSATIAEP